MPDRTVQGEPVVKPICYLCKEPQNQEHKARAYVMVSIPPGIEAEGKTRPICKNCVAGLLARAAAEAIMSYRRRAADASN